MPPIRLVNELRVPLLMLHGTLDQLVNVQEARDYEQALRENGKTFEVHYYEGAPHEITTNPSTRNDVATRTIEFFRKHL